MTMTNTKKDVPAPNKDAKDAKGPEAEASKKKNAMLEGAKGHAEQEAALSPDKKETKKGA